jgi:hypothetical protein
MGNYNWHKVRGYWKHAHVLFKADMFRLLLIKLLLLF